MAGELQTARPLRGGWSGRQVRGRHSAACPLHCPLGRHSRTLDPDSWGQKIKISVVRFAKKKVSFILVLRLFLGSVHTPSTSCKLTD